MFAKVNVRGRNAQTVANDCEGLPNCSAGYLESARILENQARYGEAFLIYYTAKQHIRPDDLYFKEIESRKSLLLSKIDQINTKSIKRLSPDVFDSILADLSLPDRIHCAQTCKGWWHKFMSWPKLWSDIDFRVLPHSELLSTQLKDKPLRRVTIPLSYM